MSLVWPRCWKCKGRVDLKPVGEAVVASCCAGELEVQLAYVPKPIVEEAFIPLRPRKGRARR